MKGVADAWAGRFLGIALLGVMCAVNAQVSETESALTDTVLTEEALAKRWHLSIEEWAKYKTLMDGPRGIWSPSLDPITVLGIDAETEAERKRYAELLVMVEFERVEKELLFQRAYDDAARRLFPDLSPVTMKASDEPMPPLLGIDRIAFVGSVDARRCPTCRAELARLMESRLRERTTLDLFLADASDDDAIRAWAREQGVSPEDVSAGRITLNHARGPWTIPATPNPIAPRLMRRSAGQWLPMSPPK
jgi:integrating conjugative element protein (TIGR03759 family)